MAEKIIIPQSEIDARIRLEYEYVMKMTWGEVPDMSNITINHMRTTIHEFHKLFGRDLLYPFRTYKNEEE